MISRALVRPILGVCVAIAITATMDATGLSAFSALPLFPLMVLFWFWERPSRSDVGFVWGAPGSYVLAVLYPLTVIGAVALIAAVSGAVDIAHTDWRKAGLNFGLVTATTMLVAIVTEEGFFRGWLWASLRRAGARPIWVLIASSLAFSLWHLSAVVLPTGFNPPPAQVPVFMVNAAVIGAIWGLMRWISGSVFVSSVSHGLWNGMAYVLFGLEPRWAPSGSRTPHFSGPKWVCSVSPSTLSSLWRSFFGGGARKTLPSNRPEGRRRLIAAKAEATATRPLPAFARKG